MFRLVKIEGGRINVFEPQLLPVGAKVTRGQALDVVDGAVKPSTGTPTYIALASGEIDEEIAVGRIDPSQIYEVEGVSDATVGAKYAVEGGALGTKGSGSVEVVAVYGTTVLVRFS
jgi:hypothetical protein